MNDLSIVPSNGGNDPLKFEFDGAEIRIVKADNGEPLFVASDVCKALDISNVGTALSRLDDDEKDDIRSKDVTGRDNRITVVTEAGLYNLIFSSRKPSAKAFKRWIASEVIPSIRNQGFYAAPNLSPLQLAWRTLEALQEQERRLDNHAERITSLESHVQTEVEYFTVLGYFRKFNLPAPSMNEAQSIGQRATKLSREKSFGVGNTSDPRFGTVHTYHVSILNEIVKR